MGPRKTKELSDSDQALVAVTAEAAAQHVLDEMRTPPAASDSSEHMRTIARDECSSWSAQHQNQCVNSGPVHDLWEAITTMRSEIWKLDRTVEGDRGELRGALRAQARTFTFLNLGIAVVTMAIAVAGFYLRVRHGG